MFKATYSDADYGNMWKAAFDMLYLFGDVARIVAAKLEHYSMLYVSGGAGTHSPAMVSLEMKGV